MELYLLPVPDRWHALHSRTHEDARGGPFVPYKLASHATPFDKQLHRINVARAQLERLNKTLVTVPIRKPVAGEIDPSSGFGVRIDPFSCSSSWAPTLDGPRRSARYSGTIASPAMTARIVALP